jgi:hypothetical protein
MSFLLFLLQEGGPGGGSLVSSSTGFHSGGGGGNGSSPNNNSHSMAPFPSNHQLRYNSGTNNTVSSTSGPVVSSSSSSPPNSSPQATSGPAFNFLGNGGSGGSGNQEAGESTELPTLSQLSQADLNGLVSTLDDDDDDLFKQLGEATFELDPLIDEILETGAGTNSDHSPNIINGHSNQNHVQQSASNQFGNNSHHHQSLQQFMTFNQNQQNNNQGTNMEIEPHRLQNVQRRRKKPPDTKMGMEITLEEAAPSILHLARASTSNSNGGKMSSILANTLCGPHGHKANIAASNPILAGRTLKIAM